MSLRDYDNMSSAARLAEIERMAKEAHRVMEDHKCSDAEMKELAMRVASAERIMDVFRESLRVDNELEAISQQIDERKKEAQEKVEKIKKELDDFKESCGRKLKEMTKQRADLQKRFAEIQDDIDALIDVRK